MPDDMREGASPVEGADAEAQGGCTSQDTDKPSDMEVSPGSPTHSPRVDTDDP